MGDDRRRHGDPVPGELPNARRPAPDDDRHKSRHSDPNDPDSGMISVQDLVKRVERDSGSPSGALFSSGSIPRVPPRPTPLTGAQPALPREGKTEIIPRITAPIAPDRPITERTPAEPRSMMSRRNTLLIRGLCAAAAALTFIVTAWGWSDLDSADGRLPQITALDRRSPDIADLAGAEGSDDYLVVGLPAEQTPTTPTDLVTLVHVPADRQRVVTVSFPGDLDVARPVCQGWDSGKSAYTGVNYPGSDHEKLNAIYPLGGPQCLVKVIQKLTGVRVTHFAGVDFAGIERLADDPPARGAGGDPVRHQDQILAAVLDSALSNPLMLNSGRLNSLVDGIAHHAVVDGVTPRALLTLARSLRSIASSAVNYLTLPTSGATDTGNLAPDTAGIKSLFTAIVGGSSLPTRTPTGAAPTPVAPVPSPVTNPVAMDPAGTSVEVLNGTGKAGVASTVAKQLGKYGYTIAGMDVTSTAGSTTVIRYAAGHRAEAATLATAIPDAQIQQSGELSGNATLDLILGSDFAGTLKSPTTAGEAITQAITTAPQ